MKTNPYILGCLILFTVFACMDKRNEPLPWSGGKIQAPLTIMTSVSGKGGGAKRIIVSLRPSELLESIQCSLRASGDFIDVSERRTFKFFKIADPAQLDFSIQPVIDHLKSVILDCESLVADQVYRSSHEILIAERSARHTEKITPGRRRIKEL